ncbi:MAG: DUF4198 domain-containing protein [Planctomycetota bacterium]|nr:MAG: DUF4198 domain-containing protein [Planctomycetota bacterium]
MSRARCMLAAAWSVAAFLLLPAYAHDLWLVPPEAAAAVKSPVQVAIAVGMDFPNSEDAPDPAGMQGRVVGPDGAPRPLSSWKQLREQKRTLVEFTPADPGAHLVYLETQPKRIELQADQFNAYLLHDGLPQVLAERMDKGEMGRPAVERYSKYVKALLPVSGHRGGTAATWRAGQRLEILPRSNPLELQPGDTLEVQVLFEDQPLVRANLCWDEPGNGEDFSGQTWTDAGGVAVVPIARRGLMTLRLIHMTRPQEEEYEWESFWSSFTFRVE